MRPRSPSSSPVEPRIPELADAVAVQRKVIQIALSGIDGFALAGSGAIREHGVTERATEDVDLFTNRQDVSAFAVAVDQVVADLQRNGFRLSRHAGRRNTRAYTWIPGNGQNVDIDMGWTSAKTTR